MTLYGLSYSVLAVQLRATNMADCVTGPLEKVFSGVLCARQQLNQGIKSSPVLPLCPPKLFSCSVSHLLRIAFFFQKAKRHSKTSLYIYFSQTFSVDFLSMTYLQSPLVPGPVLLL